MAYRLQYLSRGIVIDLYCGKEMHLSALNYIVGEALYGCIYSFLLFSDYTVSLFFSPPQFIFWLAGSEQQGVRRGL